MSELTDDLDRLGIPHKEDRKGLVLVPCRAHARAEICIHPDRHPRCSSRDSVAACIDALPGLRGVVRLPKPFGPGSPLYIPPREVEPPPPGQRYWERSPGGIVLISADDQRPDVCSRYGHNHDSLACVDCIRARAQAKRAALAEDDDGESWAPQSLLDVEPVPPPTILEIAPGDFLLRRGWVHLIHGAQASAKTPVCYIAVVEVVRAGDLALIVDYEMGRAGAKALLVELGLTIEEIEARVHYCYQPRAMTPAGARRIVAETEARGLGLAVAVIDSLSVSMSTVSGSDDNDSLDVATWATELPVWLADQFDAAVVVIDHSGVNDGDRPSGSHKKREVPQFHVWCEKVVPFSRLNPEAGRSNLVVMKDRSGEREIKKTVAEVRTRPGGSFYLVPPEPSKPGEVEVPLDKLPENATDEDVLDDARAAGTEGIMRTDLTGSGEAGKYRRRSVDRLLLKGRLVGRPDGRGGRGTRLWMPELAP